MCKIYYVDTQSDCNNYIHSFRKEQKVSMSAIGRLINIDPSSTRKTLLNQRKISIENLSKILKFLGYSLAIVKREYDDNDFPVDYVNGEEQEFVKAYFESDDIGVDIEKEFEREVKINNLDDK